MRALSFCLALLLMCSFSACAYNVDNEPDLYSGLPDAITVNEVSFSVDAIKSAVYETFNDHNYYCESVGIQSFLGKTIEYEMFYDPSPWHGRMQEIYVVITNMLHPQSTSKQPLLYKYGILITDDGLQTTFFERTFVHLSDDVSAFMSGDDIYLGNGTLQFDEIIVPAYQEMPDSWRQNAENVLKRYMYNNDFYSDSQNNLQPGNYDVYIKGFNNSDIDSTVVFVNKNGAVYEGLYYFVQHISGDKPANLNHVALVDKSDLDVAGFIEWIQSVSVFHMEYSVEQQ